MFINLSMNVDNLLNFNLEKDIVIRNLESCELVRRWFFIM